MADNVTLNSGTGGDVIATEDIAGVEYQKVKLIDGTAASTTAIPLSGDLTNGLDVDVTRVSGTVTVDGSGVTQPVSGTVTANLSAIDNAVLDDIAAQNTTTAAGFAAEAAALGSGVLIQGDDGTDRKNINVDATTGDVQVDVTNTVTVSGTITADAGTNLNTSALLTTAAHDAAFGTAGTADAQVRSVQGIASMTPLLVDATGQGDVPITLSGEAVVLGAGSALAGDVGLSGARTSGGTTLFKDIDLDETAAGSLVKASAGQVYWIHAVNLSAVTLFLKFYNQTSVTVGTTVPDLTFPIPTQGDTNGAGFTLSIPNGIAFGTGIIMACTTGVADNDSGAPGANACVVNLGYA